MKILRIALKLMEVYLKHFLSIQFMSQRKKKKIGQKFFYTQPRNSRTTSHVT